jgi:hypothetical protein
VTISVTIFKPAPITKQKAKYPRVGAIIQSRLLIRRKKMLITIWFAFAVIFFGLGTWHWTTANRKISHFSATERPKVPGVQFKAEIMGMDIDQPIKDFVAEFNKYIDDYNKTSNDANKMQAVGYWVACATAIVSGLVTVLS